MARSADQLIARRPALLGAAALLASMGPRVSRSATGTGARLVPEPAVDVQPGLRRTERAVLAGGCFWGVQGVFQHVRGVSGAVSGYAGGTRETARYQQLLTGTTDHAEAVGVRYDPSAISFGRLLQIHFSVVHDPTQVDRQGPDIGRHYRSAIFPVDAEQARVAEAYLAQLGRAGVFSAPIATRIEPGHAFYPAEAYHQDFMVRNPTHPYIVVHDLPKVEDLRRIFPQLYRAAPVLVASAG